MQPLPPSHSRPPPYYVINKSWPRPRCHGSNTRRSDFSTDVFNPPNLVSLPPPITTNDPARSLPSPLPSTLLRSHDRHRHRYWTPPPMVNHSPPTNRHLHRPSGRGYGHHSYIRPVEGHSAPLPAPGGTCTPRHYPPLRVQVAMPPPPTLKLFHRRHQVPATNECSSHVHIPFSGVSSQQ
jgi:hypothetical protein